IVVNELFKEYVTGEISTGQFKIRNDIFDLTFVNFRRKKPGIKIHHCGKQSSITTNVISPETPGLTDYLQQQLAASQSTHVYVEGYFLDENIGTGKNKFYFETFRYDLPRKVAREE